MSARADSARHAVEEKAKDAGHAMGNVASKAKVPLIASGVALAGVAGGAALGARQARRHNHKLRSQLRSRDVAKTARKVGKFGANMGLLASELQHAREASNGAQQHRSPLEVVLEGLTARRSRA